MADLHESEERYAVAVRGANDGLWDWNITTNKVYWLPRWKALLGFDEGDIANHPEEWLSRIHHEDAERVKEALNVHLATGAGHFESEHRMLHADGTYRWMRCRGAAVTDGGGRVTRLAGSLTDITEAKVADALTGLPNRLLFMDLLDRAIKRSERRRDYVFALLVLGLDRFKVVNQGMGVLSADRLLVSVSRRLQSCLRGTDAVSRDTSGFTLARLGGDEFTVLLDDISDASDAIRVAERLRAALRAPFDIEGRQIFMSATVGITVSTTGYDRPENLLQDAAIALSRAKADGTTAVELFDPAMRERAVNRLQLETDLRNAINNNELTVAYQPIISLGPRALVGFEALARWQHPTRGAISPAEFIPVAEDTGMIRQIGKIVLTEACEQMAKWQRQFGRLAPDVMLRQCLGGPVRPARSRRRGPGDPDRDRAGSVEAEAGDHGRHVRQPAGQRRNRARTSAIARRGMEHRRFRHGLLVAELSPPARGEHREDRSLLHRPHGRGRQRVGDGSRHHRPGAQSRYERRRRRGGNHRAGGGATDARMRERPGILFLAPGRSGCRT